MTKTYISLLRGINVSGQKMIKMEALKSAYGALGFENIHTYIQSGNVIFKSEEALRKDLESKISHQIRKEFGFDVPVIVLEKEDLEEILKYNPFLKDESRDSSHVYFTFLASKPEKPDPELIRSKQTQGEEFVISDKVVYLYCPTGYGKTKMTNTFLEKILKVGATSRNAKTTLQLMQMAEDVSKL